MKILHIEDEENIAFLFGRTLESNGHQYVTTPSGKWGLELLESDTFDLIILDISMPEMSGYDFLEELDKKFLDTRHNVIILSALDISAENEKRIRELGVSHIVQKPISLSNIMEVIEKFEQQKVAVTAV